MAQIHDVNELKTQAKNLRKALSHTGTEVTHAQALELVAQSHNDIPSNKFRVIVVAGTACYKCNAQ